MLSNSRPASTSANTASSPAPKGPAYQVNTQTKLIDTVHGRILCIADIRGRLTLLNDLARDTNAKAIIHTGDFGLFEASSLDRIHDRTLRHLTMYSPLISSAQRNHLLSPDNTPAAIRQTLSISMLTEFPLLLSGQIKLQVPVFTVAGACEDIIVIEKLRTSAYEIENLQIIDEATTRCLDIGGVKLRLLGLGGAFVPHKMFDNGDGSATIAGGGGTMWTTILQIGELVDTAQRVFDPSETRLLITHASPGREGVLASLALVLKADLTISAGLHFRYATSWNEFSVQGDFDGFRHKLRVGKESFDKVWDSVKGQVDAVIDEHQRVLLDKALSVIERVPPPLGTPGPGGVPAAEEPAWKNCWNWNLCDAAYGSLVLDIKEGRVSSELKSQGFNFAYRRTATPTAGTPSSVKHSLPQTTASGPVTNSGTPAPPQSAEKRAQTPAQQKSAAPSPPPGAQPTSGHVSGKDTPRSQLNGTSTPGNGVASTSGVSDKEKSEKEREKAEKAKAKRKEKKERDRAEREKEREAAGTPADGEKKVPLTKSGKTSPEVDVSAAALSPRAGSDNAEGLLSPRTDSTGARTPTSKKPPRNPWTLFIRLPNPANETELREFFGDAKNGITRVNFPSSYGGRNLKIAYVEFGDEDAMKAGLEKHGETLNDGTPEVKQADREPREYHGGGFRGGRGRGGPRGSAFATRGFMAAGLMRGGGPPSGNAERKANGDA
ncbi:hypothetical protein FA95DRAFT_1554545 [Auriscalpium vulgare]|uniref:Uncharacterized protein n=1 Tax=Auriscalpium vulgare TaxID=40419 RepID=A0ACB8S520_9AGAM|nr:hypothetical protein FA95DRAFT_1554545 [Auriscalpium vulgare]